MRLLPALNPSDRRQLILRRCTVPSPADISIMNLNSVFTATLRAGVVTIVFPCHRREIEH